MKNKMQFAAFWLGVLLCTLVAVNVWPARVALGPQGVLDEWPEDREGPGDWPDVARVVAYGCHSSYPVVVGREAGYRVTVWADYIEKEKGQAHDWERWLSFRAGKKSDKKADEDCREWRRALAKKIAGTKTRATERRER